MKLFNIQFSSFIKTLKFVYVQSCHHSTKTFCEVLRIYFYFERNSNEYTQKYIENSAV